MRPHGPHDEGGGTRAVCDKGLPSNKLGGVELELEDVCGVRFLVAYSNSNLQLLLPSCATFSIYFRVTQINATAERCIPSAMRCRILPCICSSSNQVLTFSFCRPSLSRLARVWLSLPSSSSFHACEMKTSYSYAPRMESHGGPQPAADACF